MTAKPRGRRPGRTSTRDTIVGAARHELARHGFERATIRSIAARADVDVATIYHFFEDKTHLLAAALEFPVGPEEIAAAIPADRTPTGAELLEAILTFWERPGVQERLVALLRVAATHPDAGDAVRTVVEDAVLGPLSTHLRGPHADFRAALVASQIAGIAILRLVVPFGPIAGASIRTLVEAVGPGLDRYLTGDLAEAPPPGG